MTTDSDRRPVGDRVPGGAGAAPPLSPGQMPVVLAGLTIGIALMGVQLWLLTVALDLYLSGEGDRVWGLALVSGLIVLGGLVMLRLIQRRSRVRGPLA